MASTAVPYSVTDMRDRLQRVMNAIDRTLEKSHGSTETNDGPAFSGRTAYNRRNSSSSVCIGNDSGSSGGAYALSGNKSPVLKSLVPDELPPPPPFSPCPSSSSPSYPLRSAGVAAIHKRENGQNIESTSLLPHYTRMTTSARLQNNASLLDEPASTGHSERGTHWRPSVAVAATERRRRDYSATQSTSNLLNNTNMQCTGVAEGDHDHSSSSRCDVDASSPGPRAAASEWKPSVHVEDRYRRPIQSPTPPDSVYRTAATAVANVTAHGMKEDGGVWSHAEISSLCSDSEGLFVSRGGPAAFSRPLSTTDRADTVAAAATTADHHGNRYHHHQFKYADRRGMVRSPPRERHRSSSTSPAQETSTAELIEVLRQRREEAKRTIAEAQTIDPDLLLLRPPPMPPSLPSSSPLNSTISRLPSPYQSHGSVSYAAGHRSLENRQSSLRHHHHHAYSTPSRAGYMDPYNPAMDSRALVPSGGDGTTRYRTAEEATRARIAARKDAEAAEADRRWREQQRVESEARERYRARAREVETIEFARVSAMLDRHERLQRELSRERFSCSDHIARCHVEGEDDGASSSVRRESAASLAIRSHARQIEKLRAISEGTCHLLNENSEEGDDDDAGSGCAAKALWDNRSYDDRRRAGAASDTFSPSRNPTRNDLRERARGRDGIHDDKKQKKGQCAEEEEEYGHRPPTPEQYRYVPEEEADREGSDGGNPHVRGNGQKRQTLRHSRVRASAPAGYDVEEDASFGVDEDVRTQLPTDPSQSKRHVLLSSGVSEASQTPSCIVQQQQQQQQPLQTSVPVNLPVSNSSCDIQPPLQLQQPQQQQEQPLPSPRSPSMAAQGLGASVSSRSSLSPQRLQAIQSERLHVSPQRLKHHHSSRPHSSDHLLSGSDLFLNSPSLPCSRSSSLSSSSCASSASHTGSFRQQQRRHYRHHHHRSSSSGRGKHHQQQWKLDARRKDGLTSISRSPGSDRNAFPDPAPSPATKESQIVANATRTVNRVLAQFTFTRATAEMRERGVVVDVRLNGRKLPALAKLSEDGKELYLVLERIVVKPASTTVSQTPSRTQSPQAAGDGRRPLSGANTSVPPPPQRGGLPSSSQARSYSAGRPGLYPGAYRPNLTDMRRPLQDPRVAPPLGNPYLIPIQAGDHRVVWIDSRDPRFSGPPLAGRPPSALRRPSPMFGRNPSGVSTSPPPPPPALAPAVKTAPTPVRVKEVHRATLTTGDATLLLLPRAVMGYERDCGRTGVGSWEDVSGVMCGPSACSRLVQHQCGIFTALAPPELHVYRVFLVVPQLQAGASSGGAPSHVAATCSVGKKNGTECLLVLDFRNRAEWATFFIAIQGTIAGAHRVLSYGRVMWLLAVMLMQRARALRGMNPFAMQEMLSTGGLKTTRATAETASRAASVPLSSGLRTPLSVLSATQSNKAQGPAVRGSAQLLSRSDGGGVGPLSWTAASSQQQPQPTSPGAKQSQAATRPSTKKRPQSSSACNQEGPLESSEERVATHSTRFGVLRSLGRRLNSSFSGQKEREATATTAAVADVASPHHSRSVLANASSKQTMGVGATGTANGQETSPMRQKERFQVAKR